MLLQRQLVIAFGVVWITHEVFVVLFVSSVRVQNIFALLVFVSIVYPAPSQAAISISPLFLGWPTQQPCNVVVEHRAYPLKREEIKKVMNRDMMVPLYWL